MKSSNFLKQLSQTSNMIFFQKFLKKSNINLLLQNIRSD